MKRIFSARNKGIRWVLLLLVTFTACSKSSFLDKKPSTKLEIPTTLADFQTLLDYATVMNVTPVLGEISADNYYMPYSYWQTIDTREENAYIWAPDLYGGQGQVDDWDVPYQQVFYANVVLEGLAKVAVTADNQVQWNNLQGAALFYRSFAFYNVATLFARPYDSATAASDPGIPLRLSPDINAVSKRATVAQTYQQILTDLHLACSLLPAAFPFNNRNRPSKSSAYALLARIYLSIRDYAHAGLYADSSLQLYNTLIDYNGVGTGKIPFTRMNLETMYQSSVVTYTQVLAGAFYPYSIVDSTLYNSYDSNDLRKSVFYRINTNLQPNTKGNYSGGYFPFSGLATDEMYLISAEAAARAGDIVRAMGSLNALLQNRWVTGTFHPYSFQSVAQALSTILLERRKELPFRSVRWTDLRRLNQEGANITLKRVLNGTTYTLPPNSDLYVLPIPPDVLALSGIAPNPR